MSEKIKGLKIEVELSGKDIFEKKSKKVMKAFKKLQKAIDELNEHSFDVTIKK